MMRPSRLLPRLKAMPESRLEEVLDEEQGVSVDERLHFYLVFHEAFHVGQLEPLQELALSNAGITAKKTGISG